MGYWNGGSQGGNVNLRMEIVPVLQRAYKQDMCIDEAPGTAKAS